MLRVWLALALLGTAAPAAAQAKQAAAQAAGGCRDLHGGRAQGLLHPVNWQARAGCGESTLLWFQTLAAKDGSPPEWRVDDLLIVADTDKEQSLSLLTPLAIECRHHSERQAFIVALGAWNGRAGSGVRQHVSRAWRVEEGSRKVAEEPIRDVVCQLR